MSRVSEDEAPTLQGSISRGPTSRHTAVGEPEVPDTERYELGKQIGRGGMGEVTEAHDRRVGSEVAIKRMRPDQSHDEETVQRFFREARIQGKLDHPAVAPVHDLAIDRDGNPYFVMRRLRGTTLGQVLALRSTDPALRDKWPRRVLLARFVDVCLAVDYAHFRNIVHRDLKPANIMLGDYGEVYVLDWGLARIATDDRRSRPIAALPGDSGGPMQTAVGSVLGTPGYMPPEQIKNPSVDSRADVFALGCILYEILTGTPALPSGLDALDATLDAKCHRPSERFPELSFPELDDLCARATANDRTARPNARELADAVQAYLDGDRDLARRRDLARHHARRAQEAFASEGDAARAKAMREAGRALVLDQNNTDAQGVLAHLLLDAPDKIPDMARDEANRQRSLTRQAVLRKVWPGYLGLFLLMATIYYFPLIHPVWVVIGHSFTLALTIVVWLASRRPLPIRSRLILSIVWVNAGALATGSIIFGPLMIVPVYLIGTIAGTLSQPLGYRWPAVVVPPVLAFVIPLALEAVHVMPSSFHVDHGLVLTSWAVDLTSSLAAAILITAVLSQVVIAVAIMTMARHEQDRAQDRLHAQTWHLEQLLPRRTTSQKTPDKMMSSGYQK